MKISNKSSLPLLVIAVSISLSGCYKKFDTDSYKPALSIGGYTSSAEIAPSNLVGYWSFDGSLIDSVTNASGTNEGTGFQNGVKGQALKGADKAYVLFDPGAAIKDMKSFTITFWVNSPLNTSGIVGLVNLSNVNAFWGNIDMFFENGGTSTVAKLKVHTTSNGKDNWIGAVDIQNIWNVWTSIAYKYDGSTSTGVLYANGSKIATVVSDGMGPLNYTDVGKLVFGTVQFQTDPSLTSASGAQDWASYLTGGLDEVRIYNSALSDADISALVKLEGRGK